MKGISNGKILPVF